ncbi:erythrocyte membrane protein 1, PfEMP1, putative [Plasmodium gaboni]|uniref:Erythrocyte membrane protein 1, PfEMP1, putative n=1 Tax=Plasmodium gaboni TaxID=647221 RepID=A0ABY1UI67_9APIC|nr:erythrocyte membrane protein 1, PfEMP1, putative [Plasmodium gaboni]
MGAQQSQEKSSLLKNFQYMIGEDNGKGKGGKPQYELLYFDYLNFLHYELENKAWEWEIYTRHVKGGSSPTQDQLFCGWKDIQKKIFEKLTSELKGQGATTYDWAKDVLPLIDIKQKTLGFPQGCSNSITINDKDITELKDNSSSTKTVTSSANCKGINIAEGLHIPLRRRALLVDSMYDYLNGIKTEITDNHNLEDVLKDVNAVKTKNGVAVGLTKQMIEGLSGTISDLIKQKHSTDDKAFCKEWQRTMDDYHTLLLGDDIVDENETKRIQCKIKDIETTLGRKSTDFKTKWSSYFKNIVKDLQTKKFANKTTGRSCEVDQSVKSQCVRFFEEWAEEFCKLKKDLGELIVSQCKGDTTNDECRGLCNIYTKFLAETQPYFDKYMTTCADKKFGNNQTESELRQSFSKAANSSMTDCCTDYGDCSPQQLYDVNNDISNIRYKCFCPEGEYKKNKKNDTENKCEKLKDDNVSFRGRSLAAQPQRTLAQTSGTVGGVTPQCATNKSGVPVSTIAKLLQEEVKQEEQGTGGNVGNYGESKLKAALKQAQFGKNLGENKPEIDDPCKLQKEKHTNASDGNKDPCQGKGKERFQVGKRWEKPQSNEVNNNHQDVLIPPRRKNMCTSNLENLETSNMGLNIFNFSTHSLLADVLLTAKEEANKIIDLYKEKNSVSNLNDANNKNHKECICRAMKYSFADLGDIIRGRDLWKNNTEMQKLQDKLKTIFSKIKDNTNQGVTTYQNDPEPYTKLRNHWWEANRKQIWDAMLCATIDNNGTKIECDKSSRPRPAPAPRPPRPPAGGGGGGGRGGGYGGSYTRSSSRGVSSPSISVSTPHEDYIPQKLRWLTEWAENFCRAQAKEYDKVKGACDQCKGGGNTCGDKCTECRQACDKYKSFIQQWDEDWKKQQNQYSQYYTKATTNGGTTTTGNDLNTQYLNLFLNELHKQNKQSGSNDPYGSAGGYINQVLDKKTGCEGQTEFCSDSDNKYVFQQTPSDYTKACECQPPIPPPKKPDCTGHKILDAATYKQRVAETEWKSRDSGGSKGGESKLKGDISKATFKDGKTLDSGNICELDKKTHTNDVRTYSPGANGKDDTNKHDGPCTGKGKERFYIGKKWEPQKDKAKNGYGDVLFPPRRLDMCTSNLENLRTDTGPLSDASVNDSFFGDVLLAAKEEGNMITQLHGGNTSGVCNAMKYSFADIGDIIRGRDLWSGKNNTDMTRLQDNLKEIFKNIHEKHDGIKGNTKYASDATSDPPYKNLRSDWWTANRDQIWKAMTCTAPAEANLYIPTTKSNTILWKGPKCGHDNNPLYVPPDDYIPQRLRWMTEWTENYCRKIRFDYNIMTIPCFACKLYMKNPDKMTEERKNKCKMCKGLCEHYTKFVKEWQKQWNTQKEKYEKLYQEANGGKTGSNDPIEKELDDFFQKLKGSHDNIGCTGGKDSNTYQNAADYIDSMGGYKSCKDTSQRETKTESDEAHVFKEKPHKYKTGCEWTDQTANPPGGGAEPPPPVVAATPGQPEACDIVKTILDGKSAKDSVDNCNPKNTEKSWDCSDKSVDTKKHNGACMPPRRQTLCLYNLKALSTSSNEKDLREAFIKCAAKETFFLWHYYKEHGGNSEAQNQLEKGEIPLDFMRSMFYTYGDFKDLCLDKDILRKKSNDDTQKARENIDNILKNGSTIDDQKRQEWWDSIKKDVWKGMLCGLSHHISDESSRTTLMKKEDYQYNMELDANKKIKGIGIFLLYMENIPQFLRWFTEWADEFCIKQRKEWNDLHEKCKTCNLKSGSKTATCGDNKKCADCKAQCAKYTDFIKKSTEDYNKQKTKFDEDKKNKSNFEGTMAEDDVKSNTIAHKYLHQSLQMVGLEETCMETPSSQPQKSGTTSVDMPQSLDTYPPPHEVYEKKCDCKDDDVASKPGTSGPVTTKAAGGQDSGGQTKAAVPPGNGGGAGKAGRGRRRKGPSKKVKVTKLVRIPQAKQAKDAQAADPGTSAEDDEDEEDDDEDVDQSATSGSNDPPKPMPNPNSNGQSQVTQGTTATSPDICDKVKGYITENNNRRNSSARCNVRTSTNPKKWECEKNSNLVSGEGECMPPRRQILCINYLKELKGTEKPEELKEAVMKCASIETHLSWKYYKDHGDGKKNGVEQKLKTDGKIPDDFLRSMMYTLGDFRDLVLGTDIYKSKKGDGVDRSKKNINKILENSGTYKDKPDEWWKTVESEVWDAMVCALSYSGKNVDTGTQEKLQSGYPYGSVKFGDSTTTTLSSFVSRPQFLRWMTEWAEHYCKTQYKHYMEVKNTCDKCTVDNSGGTKCNNCETCKKKCEAYKKEVLKWETEWQKQENKYKELYEKINGGSGGSKTAPTDQEKPVVKYLEEKKNSGNDYDSAGKYLTKEGYTKTCEDTKQDNFDKNSGGTSSGSDDKYAFRDYPNTYDSQCTCTQVAAAAKPVAAKPEVPRPQAAKPVVNGSQGASGGHGKGSSKTSQKLARTDEVDGGVPLGGNYIINQGIDGHANVGVTISTTPSSSANISQSPSATSASATSASTTSTTSASVTPQKEEICKNNGTVDCDKVKNGGEIPVPMDPDTNNSDRNQEVNNHKCGGIPSVTSDIKWKNKKDDSDYKNYSKLDNGVYVSPRRQTLCVKNLDQATNTDDLKKNLLTVAANQGYNLAIKYNDYKNHYGVAPCNALKYSFYDYQHIILGTDHLEDDKQDTEKKLKTIFTNGGGQPGSDGKTFWETNKKCVWEIMKCGYKKGREKSNNNNTIPECNVEMPTEFDNTNQFLMWFTEWSECFCKNKEKEYKKLGKKCDNVDCRKKGPDDIKKQEECSEECEKYKIWLTPWKDQYEYQSKKFDKDKREQKYNTNTEAKDAKDAHEYLSTKKNNCNGTCKCLKEISKQSKTQKQGQTQKNNYNIPEVFDYPPDKYKDKCTCPQPSYCVEKTAQDIRTEAHKYLKSNNSIKNLKGTNSTETLNDCNTTHDFLINKNGFKVIDEKKLESSFPSNENSCNKEGNYRLKIGNEWDCNQKISHLNKSLCVPPRRKYMCLKKLEDISVNDFTDSNKLLQKLQEVAKNEGIDILKNVKTKNDLEFHRICDAMKYSFADLGDIIRGRDNYRGPNGTNEIETKLNEVFQNVKKQWEVENINHNGKYSDIQSFRSAWWSANRREIWNAITCAAPKEAIRYITEDGGDFTRLTRMQTKCGHNDVPPDYDYIPQPLRWISEWSENFCMYQKHSLETMKDCENCKKENTDCKQKVYGACRDCKGKCQEYKKFVEKWKKQFETQSKAYNEIYTKSTTNVGTSNGIDENTKKFVDKLKTNCKTDQSKPDDTVNTLDIYLHKGNYCKKFKFDQTSKNKIYAFEEPPKGYKENCDCATNFDPLDECPVIIDICSKYGTGGCQKKPSNINPTEWNNYFVKRNVSNYEFVIVPPRRKVLCLSNLKNLYRRRIKEEDKFKESILHDAYNEAKHLWNVHKKDDQKALEAMKYSFADYGDIVKGTDMLNDGISDKIKEIVDRINKTKKPPHSQITRESWWKENKEKVWNIMMCNYNGKDKTVTECPKHGDIDETPQFLRWLIEWAKYFCKEKVKELKELIEKCRTENKQNKYYRIDQINDGPCKELLNKYEYFFHNKTLQWNELDKKYKADYGSNTKSSSQKMQSTANEYLKEKCPECNCNFEEIKKSLNINANAISVIHTILEKDKFPKGSSKNNDDDKSSHSTPKTPAVEPDTQTVPPTPPSHPVKHPPTTPQIPKTQTPSGTPTSDILTSTIPPVGISFVLGSIALLFYYMKKKPQIPATKLFRVIDIPQNDYNIPTEKSSNKYVPYRSAQYKGKTYIYVEGEETDDYIGNISSSDITSSSESEVEELDINDIYPYKSPKYKTLIEVVLKPSKSTHDAENINIDNNMEDSSDTPTNKLTDNEWNELKQDFIFNMLQTDNMDISRDNLSGTPTTNTQPNIVDNSMEEKPFITQIQDRKLYSDSDVLSYNIDWNVPENITTNTAIYNSLYSGTDLINDSLNNDQHVDIYDELLKRKENELFGTKHQKNTTTNRVAKQIGGDPILNQLDLFHTWLDRHRNMCNQCNNKEEILSKLNEKWNRQHDNISIDEVSPFNNRDKLLNTNLYVEISSDINDTSKIDMNSNNPIHSDTNRYTYFDDMELFENGSDVK